ncbi:hypothetical protein FQN60_017288, partial [Etheostoma spectabile]
MSLVHLGQQLLEAVRSGQDDDVKALMANGAPFTTDWLGSSPLHFAAQYGHHSTAEVLLRAGVSRDARTKVDKTPLHIAASEGHSTINGANINAKDMLKMTALHWAAQHGHREVAELLLRHGADLHCLSKFDKTPFDIAMDTSNTELMILLQVDGRRDGMQNQVNIDPESHYIIRDGGLVNLSDLVTATKTSAGKSEDVIAAESVEATFQHVVGDGGQRVITIVTDQHGNMQPASLGQQYIFTLQGQQMVALPAGTITEEVVVEDPQQATPKRKRSTDLSANHVGLKDKKVKESREQLQRQLQEANLKAEGYQQQLLQKEQEAEQYRLKLEQAIATSKNSINNAITATAITINNNPTAKQQQEEEEEEVMVEEQLETTQEAATKEGERQNLEEGEEVIFLPEDEILVNERELEVEVDGREETHKASPRQIGQGVKVMHAQGSSDDAVIERVLLGVVCPVGRGHAAVGVQQDAEAAHDEQGQEDEEQQHKDEGGLLLQRQAKRLLYANGLSAPGGRDSPQRGQRVTVQSTLGGKLSLHNVPCLHPNAVQRFHLLEASKDCRKSQCSDEDFPHHQSVATGCQYVATDLLQQRQPPPSSIFPQRRPVCLRNQWLWLITVDWEEAPRTGCAGGFPAGSNRTAMESRPAQGEEVVAVVLVG